MIDTNAKNFNFNLNLNIKIIRIRYQYQYQYCRIHNSISISIPIPKTIKFKLNLKTIPRYLDILQSQDNTQKIRASIAQLWERYRKKWPGLVNIKSRYLSSSFVLYGFTLGGWLVQVQNVQVDPEVVPRSRVWSHLKSENKTTMYYSPLILVFLGP